MSPGRIVFARSCVSAWFRSLVLRRLPQLVLLTQLDGEPDRAVHVLRQKQLGGKVRLCHAPGGVDARREHELMVEAVRWRSAMPASREQALQADVARLFPFFADLPRQRMRFSPTMGMTSATVPRATRSA